jgi:hypothetical protein
MTQGAQPVKIPVQKINVDVPPQVLKVRTTLENPTKFHVIEKQKNQIRQYLSDSFQGTSGQWNSCSANFGHFDTPKPVLNLNKCHSYSGAVLKGNDACSSKSISHKEADQQTMAISTISNNNSNNLSSTATSNETSDIKHSVNDPVQYKIESPSDSLMSPSISSVASTSEVSS